MLHEEMKVVEHKFLVTCFRVVAYHCANDGVDDVGLERLCLTRGIFGKEA